VPVLVLVLLEVPFTARGWNTNAAGAPNVVEARERRAMVARLKDILNDCIVTRRMLESDMQIVMIVIRKE